MPTTSNFGWTTPADTDLVKDGAAAIRTLGNGVDASLVDLKGGTTGQVLSKATNTDLDYTWVTPNVGDITEVQGGTGISVASGTGPIPVVTNTVATEFDAKGDLVVGTGSDTFDRLAVGTNGHILTADSSQTTGLKWAAPASGGANWSLLNTGGTALTAAATITVTGISGADQILVIVSEASSVNAGANAKVRFNTDSGSNYLFVNGYITAPSTYSSTYMQATSGMSGSDGISVGEMSNNAASKISGYVLASGCATSGLKAYNATGGGTADGGTGHNRVFVGGIYNSASTISSVSVVSSSGNFDNGTIYVYTSA